MSFHKITRRLTRRLASTAAGLALCVAAAEATGQDYFNGQAAAIPPAPQAVHQEPASYYAADAAGYDARLSALEDALKKKQDKPDSKKGFTRVIDGRVYFDSYHLSGDPTSQSGYTGNKDYNGLKDLRIGVKGEGFDILDYKVDLFLAGHTAANTTKGDIQVRDVWLGVKNVPLLEYVKIGHYRVEDGLSNLTGGTNTTFFEFEGRDFATGRRFGVSTQHLWAQERFRFFAGLFENRNVVQQNQWDTNGDWGTITNFRLTYLPYISKGKDGKYDGKKFLLLGANYSYFDTDKTTTDAVYAHAEQKFRDRFATLDNIGYVGDYSIGATNSYTQVGLEFARQNGPLTLQSETYARSFNNIANADPTVWGTYAEVRYFLTGDFRKFSPSSATWGGVNLNHNLDLRKVNDRNFAQWLGGWEVAAKWSYTDTHKLYKAYASATDLGSGSVNDLTLGLNWYWSPQVRVMFDYIHVVPSIQRADAGRDHSDIDIFATSFRYHF